MCSLNVFKINDTELDRVITIASGVGATKQQVARSTRVLSISLPPRALGPGIFIPRVIVRVNVTDFQQRPFKWRYKCERVTVFILSDNEFIISIYYLG